MLLIDGRSHLRVVSIEMWAELMFVDQLQQVRHVQHEQDGSKDRPLWNSAQKKGHGGRGCTTADILHVAVEIWLKPAQHVTA